MIIRKARTKGEWQKRRRIGMLREACVESWVDYVDNNEARMDRDAQAFTFGGRVKYNSYLLLPLSILGI